MKISYSWLKWFVPDAPEASRLAEVFNQHLCEVESVDIIVDDAIFDLNILPNRAHDLLCHYGVAKEVSGLLGITFKDPLPYYKIPESNPTDLKVEINTNKCPRYMARVVRNIKIGPSPDWVVKHLEAVGQRSINNIVDATNLVMFNIGQPVHAYDLRQIVGVNESESVKSKVESHTIQIQNAEEGDKLALVGSEKIVAELKSSDIVISSGGENLALAGVKGGIYSGIKDDTTDIVLEVANFDPVTIRKTARRITLSDAAKRFENHLSSELAPHAMIELSALIAEMFPDAKFEEVVDVYKSPEIERELIFSLEKINKILGLNIEIKEAEKILKNYGYEYIIDSKEFKLKVPALRLDLENVSDMAEEFGRIIGYDKIKSEIPKIEFTPQLNETHARIQIAREKLLSEGYSEVMTYAFRPKGKIELARAPKGKEFTRTNLSDGLKESYEMNRLSAPLLGMDEIKIFEIGSVFTPEEEIHVAYMNKKETVEKTLEEFTRDMDLEKVESRKSKVESQLQNTFVAWSNYPFIARDIAVWIPKEIDPDEIVSLCKKEAGEMLVKEPQVFDRFEKEGRVSVALRMIFQSNEKTLSDEEVNTVMQNITKTLQNKGFEVR